MHKVTVYYDGCSIIYNIKTNDPTVARKEALRMASIECSTSTQNLKIKKIVKECTEGDDIFEKRVLFAQ